MDEQPKTSFIPKKPLAVVNKRRHGTAGLFFVIAFVVFLITIAGAGGVYFYRSFLVEHIAALNESLETAQNAFDTGLIIELKEINARIDMADAILDKHIAFSEFFSILEKNTLKTVRFSSFDYTTGGDGTVTIHMPGVAKSYSSVALQSDLFGENKYMQNVVFSDLGLDGEGNVTFSFSADVDSTLVLYKESIK